MKNKKAVSEIISYVLLIMIALSIAAAVFAWLRVYVPPENAREKCSEFTSIALVSYNCSIPQKKLTLELDNNGNFDINGFLIMASNNSDVIPSVLMNTTDVDATFVIPGRYYFVSSLKLGQTIPTNFSYSGLSNIARIKIQPFVSGKRSLLICENFIDIPLSGC